MFRRRIQLRPPRSTVECVEVVATPTGRQAWCGRKTGQVEVVDLLAGLVLDSMQVHARRVTCITSFGHFVWTGGWDHKIVITNALTKQRVATLTEHNSPLVCIIKSPTCGRAFSVDCSGQVCAWSAETYELVFQPLFLANKGSVPLPVASAAAVSDSTIWFATRKAIFVVDVEQRQLIRTMSGEATGLKLLDEPITMHVANPTSRPRDETPASYVSSEVDGLLVLTRVDQSSSEQQQEPYRVPTTIKLLQKLGLYRRKTEGGLTYDADEALEAESSLTAKSDGDWCVLDFDDPPPTADEEDADAAGSDDKEPATPNSLSSSYEEIQIPDEDEPLDVTFLGGAFSPSSSPPPEPQAEAQQRQLATGCLLNAGHGQVWSCSLIGGVVTIWDIQSCSCVQEWLVDTNGFTCMALVEGSAVWAGANDGSIYCWQSDTFAPLHELRGHNDGVRCIAFAAPHESETTSVVLSGAASADGSLVEWLTEVEDEEQHTAFTPERHDSISYDKYGFMRFFEGASTEQPAGAFEGTVRRSEGMAANYRRWWEFMNEGRGQHYCKSSEWKALIRGGIPAKFRKLVWCQIVEQYVGPNRQFVGQDYYEKILIHKSGKRSAHTKQIALDLPRTFPNNRYFQDISCKGVQKLGRILTAFSWFNPRVGYCQGLNRIAAFTLFFLEEEDAFWCFVALVEQILTADYFVDPLIAAHTDQRIFKELVALELPELDSWMKQQDFDIEATAFHWFFGLFVTILPCEVVVRIWDSLLHEGRNVLFRFGLALLKLHQAELLKLQKVELFTYMRHNIRRTRNVDLLAQIAFFELTPDLDNVIAQRRLVCEEEARLAQQEFQLREAEARARLAETAQGQATLAAEAASLALQAAEETEMSPEPE